jgi:hypothetical protein
MCSGFRNTARRKPLPARQGKEKPAHLNQEMGGLFTIFAF